MSALMEQRDFLRDLNQLITGRRVAQFMPPADLLVDDDGVSVYMDVPGIRGEDLDIELENDILSIRGERPFPYEDRGDAAIRRIERGFGRFERSAEAQARLDLRRRVVDARRLEILQARYGKLAVAGAGGEHHGAADDGLAVAGLHRVGAVALLERDRLGGHGDVGAELARLDRRAVGELPA
jgi:HSP20 family molecular chaperone IbpA